MAKVNRNFEKLPGDYLFAEIARRTAAYQAACPDAKIVKLGIGDVTQPLAPAVIEAMKEAADEQSSSSTFKGYGPYEGYEFLRQAIVDGDFKPRNVDVSIDEIFVSDGAKSDCGNIGDIFDVDNIVAVCDPVYPVYVDSNALSGRAGDYDVASSKWTKIVYMPTTAENDFQPQIPDERMDMIYLCSPNNPTGTVLSKDTMRKWVDYANENDAVILFDAAYERFITEDDVAHSIYEIDGAKTCAIEFRSFSKTAGFTGMRCGYTVIPKDLVREGQSLNELWMRRQATKFNGASYVIQKGAAAIYTKEGHDQVMDAIRGYQRNAKSIKESLEGAGLKVFGAVNSPYVWCKTPDGLSSWDFFDKLLNEANVVTTPGAGFGPAGEGYIRLTAFGSEDATKIALERISKLLG